jgi:peptidylprolyl isomerase
MKRMLSRFSVLAAAFLFTAAAVPALAQTKNDPENTLYLQVKGGRVTIQLLPDIAPKHVARIKQLVRQKFYDGIVFHRVIPGFMAQTGDPQGTGTGGSKFPDLPAEFSPYPYKRGTVGMARTSDPNSANSQFFICFDNSGCSGLTGQYTVWGQVVAGMGAIDKVKKGAPGSGAVTNPDKMISVRVAADVK